MRWDSIPSTNQLHFRWTYQPTPRQLQAKGYFPSPDGLQCAYCSTEPGSDSYVKEGLSASSTWVAASFASGSCSCPDISKTVLSYISEYGMLFARCISCANGTKPDAGVGSCTANTTLVESPELDLKYSLRALNAMGAGIVETTATQVSSSECYQGH